MNKSETISKLATALSGFQSEQGAVGFDAKNPFLKNSYASLGALIEGSKAGLARHGLAVTQLVLTDDERVGVETVLLHQSGEWIGSEAYLPTGEEKGKSDAQVAGSMITYLRRYSYAAILGIYGDEDTDGNGSKTQAGPEKSNKPAPAPVATPEMTLEQACAITNSDGEFYHTLPSEKLSAMNLGINKGLRKSDLTDEQRAEYKTKQQAIGILLKAKADGTIS